MLGSLVASLLCLLPLPQEAAAASASDQLRRRVDQVWQERLGDSPLLASSVGSDLGRSDLPDASPSALAERAERSLAHVAALRGIPAEPLTPDERVTRAMLIEQLEDTAASFRFGEWQIPLNADSGFHTSFARLPAETEIASPGDARAYLARMRAFPAYVDQQIANMRAGMERGMTLPRVVMIGLDGQVLPYVGDVESNPFYRKLADLPEEVLGEERDALLANARAATLEGVIVGYRRFRAFLVDEYIPGGRRTLGASELPDGEAYYAYLVRRFTTLDQTPSEVHQRGLEEVARIRADMEALIESLEFEGTFDEFLEFLRTDERFYARSADALLARAARICKDVDGKLPKYFGRLPRQPYGVEPVPDAIAPKYTSGRYVRAPLESDRAGTYWVNTYALKSRPLYALPALSLHEAVPGHHLQIALTAELDHLPEFRRHSYVTAFGEGWALYTEWLGIEMGLYRDPYDEFGRMTYEMWRACRLVVDTGIHAFGWEREEAMDYLASNTALSLHECTTEVDRYISWPGQALGYKTGELEIRALRTEAEAALGERFDLPAFHDAVLRGGSVPLRVLRSDIKAWISSQ